MSPDPELLLDVQVAAAGADLPGSAALAEWVRAALRASGRLPSAEHPAELTIRIVDEAESLELNHSYRGKACPTNVLSFSAELPPGVPLDLLGDLVICAPVVAREALEQHKPLTAHWAHMVIHGILHLLGYDHVDEGDAELMESLEIAILAGLEITNPYAEMEGSTQSHG